MTIQTQKQTAPTSHDEQILVIKRSILFPKESWHGIKEVDFTHYLELIQKHKEFIPRSLAENDPTYKQIIPYLVFKHENKYFLMQRTGTASEKRLRNKYSLGIGGHIRQEDIADNNIFNWARREFHEEVSYTDTFTIKPIGLLNDDSNDVGKVHIGFVLLLQGNSCNISVKSELKSGTLSTLNECTQHYDALESWSQITLNFLST